MASDPEVITPESEQESEYWRRYRAWRRLRRYGRGSRRRRLWRMRRRFGGMSGGVGYSSGGSMDSGGGDEPDSGFSGGDSGGSGDDGSSGGEFAAELAGEFAAETPGAAESEVRRYAYRPAYRGVYRAPAYRYRAAYRPSRYGAARAYLGRRYPYYGRTFYRGRAPFVARTPFIGRTYYRGRYWPYRRYGTGLRYSPYAYRRWPWLYRRPWGYGAPIAAPAAPLALPPAPIAAPLPAAVPPVETPAMATGPAGGGGSPWISLVQSCLRKVLGPDATPMSGVFGHSTRRALRAFQQQNGLPPSGDLDSATVQALQAQCVGGGAASSAPAGEPAGAAAPPPAEPPPAGEPAPGGEPPPDGAAAAPPDGGGAPPDGGAASGDAPPPDGGAPQSEIAFDRPEGESEQEFLVDGPARIDVERHGPVPLDRDPQFAWAPNAPGVYVISVGNTPWYVGVAESSIRHRFLQRRKVLNDLQIPPTALAGRTVTWYVLRSAAVPRGAIQRRGQNEPNAPFRPMTGRYAFLRILEQVYMRRLRNPRGNQTTEPVQLSARGSLVVSENGTPIAQYQANSRV